VAGVGCQGGKELPTDKLRNRAENMSKGAR